MNLLAKMARPTEIHPTVPVTAYYYDQYSAHVASFLRDHSYEVDTDHNLEIWNGDLRQWIVARPGQVLVNISGYITVMDEHTVEEIFGETPPPQEV